MKALSRATSCRETSLGHGFNLTGTASRVLIPRSYRRPTPVQACAWRHASQPRATVAILLKSFRSCHPRHLDHATFRSAHKDARLAPWLATTRRGWSETLTPKRVACHAITRRQIQRMSSAIAKRKNVKSSAIKLVRGLSPSSTWDDLMYRIYVRQKIDAGLADIRAGRVHSHAAIRKEFAA